MTEGSLGPDYISPVYAKTLKGDPVADEIAGHRRAVRKGQGPGRPIQTGDKAGPVLDPMRPRQGCDIDAGIAPGYCTGQNRAGES